MTADDNVIDADQPRESANGQDDWQRRKSGGDKRQTNDVRLAGAPIAVEQCGGSFPVQIARSVHARTRVQNNIFNQLRHCSVAENLHCALVRWQALSPRPPRLTLIRLNQIFWRFFVSLNGSASG